MLILFIGFFVVTLILTPLAYIKSIFFKIREMYSKDKSKLIFFQESVRLVFFLLFGLLIMLFTLLADCYYFWINNFRTNLKKIVVETEKS